MPKTTIKSAHENNNLKQEESEVPSSPEDTVSPDQEIDQEPDPKVSFYPSRAQQAISNLFMPCIDGPKVDWKSMILSTSDFDVALEM